MRLTTNLTSIFILLLHCACGNNVAEKVVPLPDEVEAQSAMNANDYDTAISIYTSLISEDPDEYRYYVAISAAYAARAGIDIINLANYRINDNSPVFDQLLNFVPRNPTSLQLTDIEQSVEILLQVPEGLEDPQINSSANTQIALYGAAHATMLLASFYKFTITGQLDPETLDNMSEADAEKILAALEIAASSGDTSTSSTLAKTIATIEEAPGSSSADKLKTFLILSASEDN